MRGIRSCTLVASCTRSRFGSFGGFALGVNERGSLGFMGFDIKGWCCEGGRSMVYGGYRRGDFALGSITDLNESLLMKRAHD